MANSDEEKLNRDEEPEPDNDVKPPEFDSCEAEASASDIEEVRPPEFETVDKGESEDVQEDVEPPAFDEAQP